MIILGLGSNLGDREKNILKAITRLSSQGDIFVDKVSSIYQTEPVGLKEQPQFLNAVVSITTSLTPGKLLERCLEIEKMMGRIRTQKWGPRVIDIDIIIYNDVVLCTDELYLPHPRMHERNFVLIPLAEITKNVPIYRGLTADELLARSLDKSNVCFFKKIIR